MNKIHLSFKFRDIIICCITLFTYITAVILSITGYKRIGVDFCLVSILCLDIAIANYTLKKTKRNIVLLIFTITLNVLILSRVFTKWIIRYDNLQYETEAGNITNLYNSVSVIFISLACVFIAYRLAGLFFKKREKMMDNISDCTHSSNDLKSIIRIVSQISFYILFLFSVYVSVVTAMFIMKNGYLESFKSFPSISFEIRTIASLTLPAFAIFLATMPSKKQIIIPTLLYGVIMALSLLSGRRNIFVRDLLMLLIYLIMRDDVRQSAKKIFTKTRVLITGGIGLISIYMLQGMRTNFSGSFLRSIFNFIYDQGASIKVVVKTIIHHNIFSDNPLRYLFYPIELQLRNGFFGALFNLSPIVESQTAIYAATTYNYAHKLTYFVEPARYLEGGGFGASYIADGYILFGVLGVIIVSIILGALIRFLPSLMTRSVVTIAFGLMFIRYVVYMPRNFFIGFIPEIFNFPYICFIGFIFALSLLIKKVSDNLKRRNEVSVCEH